MSDQALGIKIQIASVLFSHCCDQLPARYQLGGCSVPQQGRCGSRSCGRGAGSWSHCAQSGSREREARDGSFLTLGVSLHRLLTPPWTVLPSSAGGSGRSLASSSSCCSCCRRCALCGWTGKHFSRWLFLAGNPFSCCPSSASSFKRFSIFISWAVEYLSCCPSANCK